MVAHTGKKYTSMHRAGALAASRGWIPFSRSKAYASSSDPSLWLGHPETSRRSSGFLRVEEPGFLQHLKEMNKGRCIRTFPVQVVSKSFESAMALTSSRSTSCMGNEFGVLSKSQEHTAATQHCLFGLGLSWLFQQ